MRNGLVSVLIVEDEEHFRNALVYEFRKKGFDVLSANNGREALKILEKEDVDVVISDIMMPEATGIDLLEKIKNINPTMPIVLLMTGFADISSKEARQLGAEALFCKPFDRKALVEAVVRLAQNKGAHLQSFSSSIRTDLPMTVRIPGRPEKYETRALNISLGGVFIPWQENFPEINDSIGFDLVFNDKEAWRSGAGTVKWISFKPLENAPSGIGVEFSNLSSGHKVIIQDMIEKRRLEQSF